MRRKLFGRWECLATNLACMLICRWQQCGTRNRNFQKNVREVNGSVWVMLSCQIGAQTPSALLKSISPTFVSHAAVMGTMLAYLDRGINQKCQVINTTLLHWGPLDSLALSKWWFVVSGSFLWGLGNVRTVSNKNNRLQKTELANSYLCSVYQINIFVFCDVWQIIQITRVIQYLQV